MLARMPEKLLSASTGLKASTVHLTEKLCTLEELLRTDKLYVDFFNTFLQLPSFPEPVVFNPRTGGFEVRSEDVRSKLAADLRNTLRAGRMRKPIYDVTRSHSFSPIPLVAIEKQPSEVRHIKTLYDVQTLDIEQGIEWIKTERLPAFLESDCYIQYRLAKLLSQTELRPLPQQLINIRLIMAPPVTYENENSQQLSWIQQVNDRLLMSKLYINRGNTPDAQTEQYISQAKLHFNCMTTSSTSSQRRPADAKITDSSLPDPVCIVDTRFIAPVSATYVNPKQRTCPTDSPIASYDMTASASGASTADNDSNENDASTGDENHIESVLNSDDDYDSESDKTIFCQHRRQWSKIGRVLSRLSGIRLLLQFLSGTAGEKYWNLWLDIERARLVHNNAELHNHLVGMRERYCNSGAVMELPMESKKTFGLIEPSDWNINKLNSIQAKVLEPLINYWVPRFLSSLQAKSQLDRFVNYQEHLKLRSRPSSCPEPRTAVYQPHRPRSCRPRDRLKPTSTQMISAASSRISPAAGIRRIYSASASTGYKRSANKDDERLQTSDRSQTATDDGSFNGSQQMEALLLALSSDNNAGRVFRKHVDKSANFLWRNCLRFWQCCQEYHQLFYTESINPYLITKKAKYIFATFILVTAPMKIPCDGQLVNAIGQKLAQATEVTEDIFDQVEEYVLLVLYDAWRDVVLHDSATYNKVDKVDVKRRLCAAPLRQQKTGELKLSLNTVFQEDDDTALDNSMTDVLRTRLATNNQSVPDGAPQIPIKFREFSLMKIVHNRFELDHFRRFLSENYASHDLACWLEIEALRRIPTVQGDIKTKKASLIRRKFFNINYFFGPNSPATKEEQEKVMEALGGRTHVLLDLPPPVECLYNAQTYVERRLNTKWLPLFLSTPQFAERQRLSGLRVDHVADDVIMQRRRKALAIQRLLGNKWQVSQEKINHFRMSLLNPLTVQQFRRYISIKGEFHENNVLFWLEIEKFKEMYQLNSDHQMIQQKAIAIISCFLDSQIPPAVQVTAEPEIVQVVLERKWDVSQNMFREAQRRVFIELMPQWEEFCKYRDQLQLSDEQFLMVLEDRRRAAVKTMENGKAQKRLDKTVKENRHSKTHCVTFTDDFDPFGSIDDCSSATSQSRPESAILDGREPTHAADRSLRTQRHRVISWSYSRYIQALNKEHCLNQTAGIASSGLQVQRQSATAEQLDIDGDQVLDNNSLNVIKNALNSMPPFSANTTNVDAT